MVATIGHMQHGGPMYVFTQGDAQTSLGVQSRRPHASDGIAATPATMPEPFSQPSTSVRSGLGKAGRGHYSTRANTDVHSVPNAVDSFSRMAQPQQVPAVPGALEPASALPRSPCNLQNKAESPEWDELSKGRLNTRGAWWKNLSSPLVCPLSNCPIAMLPYPPFKLRLDPQTPSPYKLVDGRYLALQLVASGHMFACGRELLSTDVQALDEYIRRCKLGTIRPGRVATLAKELASATSLKEALQAQEQLWSFSERAKAELAKLRRIQDKRLKTVPDVAEGYARCDQAQDRQRTTMSSDSQSNSMFRMEATFAASAA